MEATAQKGNRRCASPDQSQAEIFGSPRKGEEGENGATRKDAKMAVAAVFPQYPPRFSRPIARSSGGNIAVCGAFLTPDGQTRQRC